MTALRLFSIQRNDRCLCGFSLQYPHQSVKNADSRVKYTSVFVLTGDKLLINKQPRSSYRFTDDMRLAPLSHIAICPTFLRSSAPQRNAFRGSPSPETDPFPGGIPPPIPPRIEASQPVVLQSQSHPSMRKLLY